MTVICHALGLLFAFTVLAPYARHLRLPARRLECAMSGFRVDEEAL